MTTIAVAGATGTVGAYVVAALERAGHRAVSISRSAGVDVTSGADLAHALHGVDTVIDVLNVATRSADRSREFFGATTASLLAAERAQGVRHHVLLSIVGIESAPVSYYAGKLRQEELVRSGEVPWTILRATQFHEFAGQLVQRAALGPMSVVPTGTLRPVAAREVGDLLAALATGEPTRTVENLRGPRTEQVADMARRTVAARGEHRRIVAVPLPGRLGHAMRDGTLCGDPSAREGSMTFTDWLSSPDATATSGPPTVDRARPQ